MEQSIRVYIYRSVAKFQSVTMSPYKKVAAFDF